MPKKLLKVLIIDPAHFVGGAELFTIDLVNYIQSNFSNIQIDIVFNGNLDYKKLLAPNIKVFAIDFPRLRRTGVRALFNLYTSVRAIRKIIKIGKYDIVHTNSVRAHITGSMAVSKCKTKLFWFMHDFTAPKILTRFFIFKPTGILCCSESVKKYVLKINKNIKNKITVVPNGIDTQQINKFIKPVNPQITNIGIIGRIDPWKGQHYFIRTADLLLNDYPNLRFFVIGSPNHHDIKTIRYFSKLEALVKSLGREKEIILTGFKPNIWEEISKLDIIVHSSIEPEPFGRVIIEAMSMKKPVIATNLGGPQEIITSGENGLLIPPKNIVALAKAINLLLRTPELAVTMGQKAYETVQEKYSMKIVCDKVVDTWLKSC